MELRGSLDARERRVTQDPLTRCADRPVRRRVRVGLLGLGLVGVCTVPGRGLAQDAIDTTGLTVRRDMATGTRTERAGEQWLDSIARVYVPQACVGSRRCPLVVSTFLGSARSQSERQWALEQAEMQGMIFLEPLTGTDSALKRVLRTFAIEPDKIALLTGGYWDHLGVWFKRGGGHVPEVFSRVTGAWWADVADTIVPLGPQPTATQQVQVPIGVTEDNGGPVYITAFKDAQALHRAGYPVAYTGVLRRHVHCREDSEDGWQWLADSWATRPPVSLAPSLPRASADSTLLTEESFTRLVAFWERFRDEESRAYSDWGPYTWGANPDDTTMAVVKEDPPVPTRVHRKVLTLPFGSGLQPMEMLIADMPALAAADLAIAGDLQAVGFTAQQEETDRMAFIQALVTEALAGQGLVTVEPTSVLGKNVEFVKAEQKKYRKQGWMDLSPVERLQSRMAECHAG